MCIRTNSSYSPRRFSSSIARTNRRFSAAVSVLTSLRVYATVSPHVRPVAVRLPQLPSGSQFVDGRPGGVQRGGVRPVVVDHAQPGTVRAAHQVQRASVHGDVPPSGAESAARGGRGGADAADPAAPVRLVEDQVGGPFGRTRHPRGDDDRDERHRDGGRAEEPEQQIPPAPAGGGGGPPARPGGGGGPP